MDQPPFHLSPNGERIAYHHRPGHSPTLVFLPGYMSDMTGSKAMALDMWAAAEGRAMLRLDYSGCGASGGAFEDGTLVRWRDDVLGLLDSVVRGPVVLVGSSMGGWLMLLVALARPAQVRALVGIAAAPDFTDWGFDAEDRARLARDGRISEASEYSDDPYVTTRALWESGQANLVLTGPIELDVPVRLLHGQRDEDVPFGTSLRFAERLRSADVQTLLIKDGDHRLSRDSDLALLIATVAQLLETL